MNQTMNSPDTLLYSSSPQYQRWLNGRISYKSVQGDEYEEILLNISQYSKIRSIPIVAQHPEEIYYQPQNGFMYFLKQSSLRNLGFPRLKDNNKKIFKWKKMNFQTPLPKHNPKVSYIVCSTTSNSNEYSNYRMHIVQLYSKRDEEGVLLCHVLQIQGRPEVVPTFEDESFLQEIRECAQNFNNIYQQSQKVYEESALLVWSFSSLQDNDIRYIKEKMYGPENMQKLYRMQENLTQTILLSQRLILESHQLILHYEDL